MATSEEIMAKAAELQHALEGWVTDLETNKDGQYTGDQGYGDYDRVIGWFEPFAELPKPSASESAFNEIEALAGSDGLPEDGGSAVEGIQGGLSSARGERDTIIDQKMSEWKGDAADAFRDFISPIREVANTQMAVAKVLALTLAGNKALVEEARKDALNIAELATRCAGMQMAGTTLNFGTGVALGTSVAAMSIAAAIASPAGLGFTVLGGIAVVVNAFEAKNGTNGAPEVKLGAMGPDALARNVKEALDDVEAEFRKGQQDLKEVLDSVTAEMGTNPLDFVTERPNELVSDSAGAHREFRPPAV